jgi:hypothetical protein
MPAIDRAGHNIRPNPCSYCGKPAPKPSLPPSMPCSTASLAFISPLAPTIERRIRQCARSHRRDRWSGALLAGDLERVSQCIGGCRDRRIAGDDVGEAVACARLIELCRGRVKARP